MDVAAFNVQELVDPCGEWSTSEEQIGDDDATQSLSLNELSLELSLDDSQLTTVIRNNETETTNRVRKKKRMEEEQNKYVPIDPGPRPPKPQSMPTWLSQITRYTEGPPPTKPPNPYQHLREVEEWSNKKIRFLEYCLSQQHQEQIALSPPLPPVVDHSLCAQQLALAQTHVNEWKEKHRLLEAELVDFSIKHDVLQREFDQSEAEWKVKESKLMSINTTLEQAKGELQQTLEDLENFKTRTLGDMIVLHNCVEELEQCMDKKTDDTTNRLIHEEVQFMSKPTIADDVSATHKLYERLERVTKMCVAKVIDVEKEEEEEDETQTQVFDNNLIQTQLSLTVLQTTHADLIRDFKQLNQSKQEMENKLIAAEATLYVLEEQQHAKQTPMLPSDLPDSTLKKLTVLAQLVQVALHLNEPLDVQLERLKDAINQLKTEHHQRQKKLASFETILSETNERAANTAAQKQRLEQDIKAIATEYDCLSCPYNRSEPLQAIRKRLADLTSKNRSVTVLDCYLTSNTESTKQSAIPWIKCPLRFQFDITRYSPFVYMKEGTVTPGRITDTFQQPINIMQVQDVLSLYALVVVGSVTHRTCVGPQVVNIVDVLSHSTDPARNKHIVWSMLRNMKTPLTKTELSHLKTLFRNIASLITQ